VGVACRVRGGEGVKLVSATAVELVKMEASLEGAPGRADLEQIKKLINA
jgi:hypothetical protein